MTKELAIAQFVERCAQHRGKRIDNSRLHAGSPMHYYCKHCDAPTETLPELHREPPTTVCVPCNALDEQGLLAEAKKAFALKSSTQQLNQDP